MTYTIPFSQLNKTNIPSAGGKGANLGEMTTAGFPVPGGFVLTTAAYDTFVQAHGLQQQIIELAHTVSADVPKSSETALEQIKQLFLGAEIPQDIVDELLKANDELGETAVAVRSSATAEDLPDASFAGQQESYLNVQGKEALLNAVKECWASLWTARAITYRLKQAIAPDDVSLAVVVQKQIESEVSGVAFSLNPNNNDYDEAVINSNFGLGESIVSGLVTPDSFVVNKVTNQIVEKQLATKAYVLVSKDGGGMEESTLADPKAASLTDAQVIALTRLVTKVEAHYKLPMDIEWAYQDGELFLLQARPVTAYVPLPPEMMTQPDETRILYMDTSLTEGVTINRPMSPLTIDWMFGSLGLWVEPFYSPIKLDAAGVPEESLLFGTGGRFYMNLSQVMTIYSLKKLARDYDGVQMDALLSELLANIDEAQYKAEKKIPSLGWWSMLKRVPRALWSSRHFISSGIFAFVRPEKFYLKYELIIEEAVERLKQGDFSHLTLREMTNKLSKELTPVISKASFPALMPYLYYVSRLNKMFGDGSEETKQLVESMSMGFAGNEAVNIGIQQYRMAKMLTPADFSDLDVLAEKIEARTLPAEFLRLWDTFVAEYGLRGPGELELANGRYGDDPKLALEQMSYMVNSDFDPIAMQRQHVAEREEAYQKLRQKVNGRKRKKLEKVYKILDLYGPTRDTPKYLWVLDNGAVRRRALQEGLMFVEQDRLDTPEDIFWFTLDEIDAANANSNFDLRQVKEAKQPFYRQLDQVIAFPHIIDSRGRIGQAKQPETDPNILTGLGVSRGVATGRIKILHTPREKPIEKGDILVAYTTDPGWTPLFVNAEAVLLEVGGMLQHGGVVAREYGKPCVAGIQGITTTLQDGQRVEVDGTTGIVRILAE